MTVTSLIAHRALLGGLAVLATVLLPVGGAVAATADCGGGDIGWIQAADDPETIVGARVSGVGAACDGQPVGVQFLGNDDGDPAAPAVELAHAYSDEDPCTGEDRPDGVLVGGTVDVLLCDGSSSSGYVEGRRLTHLRLITTRAAAPSPTPTEPPAGPADPAPAPDPAPDPAAGDDLPMTGAELLRTVLLGAVLVLVGGAMVREAQRPGGP